ncbi:polymorphic toxin type 15 domain-containing protein [Paraliobacillus ryukyuensis]|uniref:polymorphic toxin type 15 domain-containing protein n=1 Tax=Paraliobacillus ryukyuensis TaxID=200904 RepID=UPI0009A68E23|nr:polymorphic toxin type 15 domain-containing protein [Paraliobacillus ryukyuensis]
MGSTQTLETKSLIETVEYRVKEYQALSEQLDNLRTGFQEIVDLDNFTGKSADAIKAFYLAQIDVVEAWQEFITMQISFFEGVEGLASDFDLDGETLVEVPFLEGEVARGIEKTFDMVDAQQSSLQSIFSRIHDLISLEVFSKSEFEAQIEEAEKKRKETTKKVKEFDNLLLDHYRQSSVHEQVIVGLIQELMHASSRDGDVSPIHFNNTLYQESEIHQYKKEAKEMTASYLDYQKKLEENRELRKKKEEMENRAWYEKTWDSICTFTGEVTGYYDVKRASTGIDPVTNEKLSNAERVTAGAWAAAGFIPFVGWAGKAVKGGKGIYSATKVVKATDHVLDAYQSTKAFDILKQTEYGIYGLASYNGFSEYITGKDMFGNDLSDEKRDQSLVQSLFALGTGGASVAIDRMQLKNSLTSVFPTTTPPATVPKRPKSWSLNQAMTWLKHQVPEVRVMQDSMGGKHVMFAKKSSSGSEMFTKGTGNVKHLDDVPRIKEVEVNFKRNDKHDSEEFARQLKDQEKGMNELTVDEYLKNREKYIEQGRAIEGNAAQQATREKALNKKIEELFESGMSWEEAEIKANSWLKTQAALHNPDQIAGGNPLNIGGMGDKRINSSIGSQWKYRIDIVDEQIGELAKLMTPEQRKSTYLNVKLTH